MVKMIADRPFTYAGRELSKGVEFEASDADAHTLTVVGFAHVKVAKQEYQTRVMTAKSTRNKRVEAA